jgi:excisionase family DNA binding protein
MGGSVDPRGARAPKGSTQGEARVGGRGRARTTGSPNVGSCGGRVAAATCTGGVGFASLSAPRSLAGSSRSRSVAAMAPPTSQLQDPQPVAATLIDAAEAARLLSVPASWVLAEARADRIPHVRLGRYVRFSMGELEDWWRTRARGPWRDRGAAAKVAQTRRIGAGPVAPGRESA